MAKKEKDILSNEQRIKAFLFTVEAYMRIQNIFKVSEDHSLMDEYTEADYVSIMIKLIVLRKYSYNKDSVYIPAVINAAESLDTEGKLIELKNKYDEVENNHLQAILADGSALSLFDFQECVLYGMYLHADLDKISKLLKINEGLAFSMVRSFVEAMEKIVFELYTFLNPIVSEKFERIVHEKAPVIFVGDKEKATQSITGSPYWSNIYGRDADEEELAAIMSQNTSVDNSILMMCIDFLEEVVKEDYSEEFLEKLVFPPTREQWGDFSSLHKACKKDYNHLGWSSKVRYNEAHDMAYVYLHPNVDAAFILDQPHVITDLSVISLVYEKKYGWRIISIGKKVDSYKENISLFEWIKRTFLRKRRND